uniref:superoxide dismutase n=2 Tax=Latimeria chalumnae TaxID=7897 RepID=H3B2L7_LATCH
MAALTEADKQNIRGIWKTVFENAEENGRTIVIRLFEKYPETKVYFKNFKNISTMEEMQKNEQIRIHGLRVMNSLNQVIQNIDNLNEVYSILTHLAKRHQYVHRVDVHNFKLIFGVIIKILKEALGATFTEEICTSWQKMLSFTYDYLVSCYHKSSG